jgi:hypothetical protein
LKNILWCLDRSDLPLLNRNCVCLLPGSELCGPQLFHVKLLSLLYQLLSLIFERFPLSVHDNFELFKVAQFDLQLLHLRFDQQRYQ